MPLNIDTLNANRLLLKEQLFSTYFNLHEVEISNDMIHKANSHNVIM